MTKPPPPAPSWRATSERLTQMATTIRRACEPLPADPPTPDEAKAIRKALSDIAADVGKLKKVMGIGQPQK